MTSESEPQKKAFQVIRVSAPGKVILHGEHSVVYGKRAIALSLDLRTRLTAAVGGDSVSLDLPDVDIKKTWPIETVMELWKNLGYTKDEKIKTLTEEQSHFIRSFLNFGEGITDPKDLAILSFFHLYISILHEPLPISITVGSQLPTGAGLGSSAAYAVCLSGALLHLCDHIDLSKLSLPNSHPDILKTVSEWAYASEKIVHGTPSGIDNSVCTYGGAVSFKAGNIEPIHVPPLKVLLVNTLVPRSTKALVAGVRERKERVRAVVEPILTSLDAIADKGLEILCSLKNANVYDEQVAVHEALDELIDINQALLCAIGVSHPSLDKLVGIAKSHGLHAKLTGAGGGGFGIVVVSPKITKSAIDACCDELRQSGYDVWCTSVGAPGISFHNDI
ncbi:hypothetical protein SK128_011160 [Halocaridina rubra]|uniref:Mevalonate kinase n=1 Tax=Halocaridina rubra TaxID=373956 RepID=A0AAN8WYK9_HALRR